MTPTTPKISNDSALSINCTSTGILVNVIPNLCWNDGVNYALNVTGYSKFSPLLLVPCGSGKRG